MKWDELIYFERKVMQDGYVETKLRISPWLIGIAIIILVVIIALT